MSSNQAAYLHAPGTPLIVSSAPMPTCGPDEIVVKNAAVAINPLDWHMANLGIFIQQFPAVFGCDVAGTVHEVGQGAAKDRFKVGDRVIGHTTNLVTARPQDGAFALYTTVPSSKAAILPANIPFSSGVVLPTALEAAICALFVSKPGTALPEVPIPTLGLPRPFLTGASASAANPGSETPGNDPKRKKTLIIWGASSSVGLSTTQLASLAGIDVIATAGPHNFSLVKSAGAPQVFDHADPEVVAKLIEAVTSLNANNGNEFVGIVDAISTPDTYTHDIEILSKLGGGQLACTHPPPSLDDLSSKGVDIQAGMIFAVNEAAMPIWEEFVTGALELGALKCLPPPKIILKGLEAIQEGLKICEAGVSGAKVVVEL